MNRETITNVIVYANSALILPYIFLLPSSLQNELHFCLCPACTNIPHQLIAAQKAGLCERINQGALSYITSFQTSVKDWLTYMGRLLFEVSKPLNCWDRLKMCLNYCKTFLHLHRLLYCWFKHKLTQSLSTQGSYFLIS